MPARLLLQLPNLMGLDGSRRLAGPHAISGDLKRKLGLTVEATRIREVIFEVVVEDRATCLRFGVIDVVWRLQKVVSAS